MKRIIYVSVLMAFFFFANLATAKNLSELDGTDWNKLPETAKAFFVGGFIVGTDYVFKQELQNSDEDFRKGFDIKKGVLLSNKIWAQDKKDKNNRNIMFTKQEIIFWGQYRSAVRTMFLGTYMTELAVEQITSGLNILYQDFKNSNITIPDAIYVVKKQIKGLSSEDTEKILLYLRGGKKDQNLLKVMASEGKTVKELSFP